MDCIYLNSNKSESYCHAQPIRPNEVIAYYKPTESELKHYCRSSEFLHVSSIKGIPEY